MLPATSGIGATIRGSQRLRGPAWFWSVENLLLAAPVYNRLHIYIGFNRRT